MSTQEVSVEETSGSFTRPQARRALGVALGVAVLALGLDQGSKALAVAQLTPGERVPLLGDLFGLSLVYNPGAAFSLGSGATWIITLVGVLAAVAVVVFALRMRGARWGVALGLILGGAVGNLIDRLVNPPSFGQGHVTDFLAYGNLFVGNVADVFVVIGVGLVCLNLLRSTPRTTADSERTDSAS
ncbi:signal peptidase II [Microbacterium laevaniformans]|uniref:Lipoprotein signal peptidase n=1 Tax=Microbacterium laevaniformans TaxID=36807 RepID=A0A150HIV5_9MICO|nr:MULTISPECIES: signal peptidase II [Microbacterium]EIC06440.1 Lipoprotein signal peptidase [Microbacterium laevaniformans OR221]KXZ61768.1 Lipoprotein signal peptidase [Microbacterium laevaniformans]MBN9223667.1 signal peptidase II [Microbacterium sp.]ODT27340.1 MAG: signal peptidase II [Microbacterium sp. SCN 70-27]TGY36162.1 signal peptidase II [Microbacterium laevaniformans]